MEQALFPFFLYLLIQILVVIIGMNWKTENKEIHFSSFLSAWIYGQMTLFAIIQALALPMIQLHLHFNVLFFSFLVIAILMTVRGGILFFRIGKQTLPSIKKVFKGMSPTAILFLLLASFIIFDQFCIYFLGQHIDWDDARWLAQANDALAYGDMIARSTSTGELLGAFTEFKELSSPWPMMMAILTRVLQTRVTIAMHTIYAPFELIAMYAVYYLIAKELFNKQEARFAFVFFVGVIMFFFGGTRHTQAVVSLVRIWQGKATVAAVLIPLMIYLFICIHKRNEKSDWLKLPVICCAACLMSGMGVAMAAILTGIFGAYDIIFYRRWKRIPLWILAFVPVAVSGFIYFTYTR